MGMRSSSSSSSRSRPSSVEDVGELMQQIQSQLPVEEAARTSVLSKSWLHAWSTIPTLRFCVSENKHLEVVDRTVNRYLRDNIPILRFELKIEIQNEESASLTEKWIRSVATKTKELSISIPFLGASLTLPDEILLNAENLTKLSVTSSVGRYCVWLNTPTNTNNIINCASLREFCLTGVRTSQEVLDGIFSSASLLESVKLRLNDRAPGRNPITIKISNLARLHELRIYSRRGDSTDLEISHVPNLRLFKCDLLCHSPDPRPLSAYSLSLGRSVTELWLGGLITDEASLDKIKTGFPLLESLTLNMGCWRLQVFRFTCASLKTLILLGAPLEGLIDVQVVAPKLISFLFQGRTLPSLSFPVSTLNQTTFELVLYLPLDASFFLRMREALALSSKCDVSITAMNCKDPMDIDIDDLRTRLPYPPANNVERLEFQALEDECLSSPFFDAFFEICHPGHVLAKPDVKCQDTNHFCELMLREVLNKKKKKKTITTRPPYWPCYLKNVEISVDENDENWETLGNSHRTSLDGPILFKLSWR